MAKVTELLADLAGDAFLQTTKVTSVEKLSPSFVRISIQDDGFRSTQWTPGTKLQLRPNRGTLSLRTYTPTHWDTDLGSTDLLAYAHGDGPAARWFTQVAVDDACEVLGPRRSIDLSKARGRLVFVGDESSVGLACALRTVNTRVRHVFEASDPAELTTLLSTLGFEDNSTIVEKSTDRKELIDKSRAAADSDNTPFGLIASGDAATVHALRRAERGWQRRADSIAAKAYWARGRTGLD
ncbi:siderophore-interacting protein [Nocardia callitridis]|uniref:FAD-binding FR-type domain-containing protein n=1 Tax=Nocardia callitridis TaxID=648753 RepID=A0ABP9JTJ4_9NOCA